MAEGTSVGSLYYDLSIDDKNLKSQLDDADKKVTGFADKLHDGLNKAAIGFAAVGAGLTIIAKQSTDFAVNAVKGAKSLGMQIGVSTEEASRLTAALGRMGISTESASQVFGIFSKNIVKATQDTRDQAGAAAAAQLAIEKTQRSIAATTAEIQKSGDKSGDLSFKLKELNSTLSTQQAQLATTANAFQRLGISTVDAQGHQKGFNALLFEVADKFKGMPNGIDKTALSMELFGRSGKDMIKVLNLGSAGISDLEKEADKLGLTLTSSNITAVNDYIKSQKDLKQSTDALKLAVGTTTAPVLTAFNKTINDIVLSLINSDGPLKTITVNVLAFGGPIAAAAGGLLAFAANLVTAWPAIVATTGALWGMATAVIAATWPFILAGGIIAGVAALIIVNWETVSGWFTSFWQYIQSIWDSITGGAVAAWQGIYNTVTGAVNGIKNAVVGVFTGAGKWLFDAGKNIIQGLLDGAASLLSKIGEFFLDKLPGWIKTPFKKALGIASPSKVFAEMGRNVTAGFVKGVNDTQHLAMNAMSNLSNAVISPSLNLSASGAGAGGGSTTSYGDTVISIGQINNAQDEAFVLRRLDRNQYNESRGGSPVV